MKNRIYFYDIDIHLKKKKIINIFSNTFFLNNNKNLYYFPMPALFIYKHEIEDPCNRLWKFNTCAIWLPSEDNK